MPRKKRTELELAFMWGFQVGQAMAGEEPTGLEKPTLRKMVRMNRLTDRQKQAYILKHGKWHAETRLERVRAGNPFAGDILTELEVRTLLRLGKKKSAKKRRNGSLVL